jgi:O-antigen/teichoic acid export membrane protein
LRKKIQAFSKRPFVRNVITVAGGTALAQAIGMAFAPFITRLYGPEVFGLQGLFMSVAGLLSTLAAMSYPTAIVLSKSDANALGLARLSIYIGFCMALIAAIALDSYSTVLFSLINAESISVYAFLIPVAMFFSVLGEVLSQWLIRKREFALTAKFAVLTAFVVNSVKTGIGVVHPTAVVLIITNIIGTVVGTALAYLGWQRLPLARRRQAMSIESTSTLSQLAKRHRDFPLLRTPQKLINAFSQSLPILLLGSYFGANAAGQYIIAISVLGIPAMFIGGSVISVFYPRINEALHCGENASSLIVRATLGMAVSGAMPFLIVMVAGPHIFQFVFGEAWRSAGVYAQWLSIWIFLQFINSPAVAAIPALGMHGGLLVYEVFSTGTKILALWLGFAVFGDPVIAVALFSLCGSAAYIWLIWWVLRRSSRFTLHTNSK